MSAAYPNQTDAENAVLSAMEFTSTYSSDGIKERLLPHFTEFLEDAIESLVTKGFLERDGSAYSMTRTGYAKKLRNQQRVEQIRRTLNRNV